MSLPWSSDGIARSSSGGQDVSVAVADLARVVLDIRIVCSGLAILGMAIDGPFGLAGFILLCLLCWQVVAMTRWELVGLRLCQRPLWVCLDIVAGFIAVGFSEPIGTVVLVPASATILAGLSLDRSAWLPVASVTIACWIGVLVAHPQVTADQPYLSGVVVPVVLIGLLFVGTGIRRIVLRASAAETARLREVRLTGVAEERARLAREMHDSLAKTLHGVTMMADALPTLIATDPAKARRQAEMVSEALKVASRESRSILLSMRRAISTEEIGAQISNAAERWMAVSGRDTEVRVDTDAKVDVSAGYELVAILNEALENVARHTPVGTPTRVLLSEQAGWIHLCVEDRGPGASFDAHQSGIRVRHYGVVGMRERAARAGGQFEFRSAPGEGTKVLVRIPAGLDESAEEHVNEGVLR